MPNLHEVRFLAHGRWSEDAIHVSRVASTRRLVPEVEQAIDLAWEQTNARVGISLFDGPVCRLESFNATPHRLEIAVSTTSYRINIGTNFCHPEFAARFGRDVMANPVGVSAGLLSADGFLILGRRNGSVAYYPHLLHPFAGSLEVRDAINLFDDVRRELKEEVHLLQDEICSIECIGIVEDQQLLHPETIFAVRTSLGAREIQARVHHEEHGSSQAIPCEPEALGRLAARSDVTPVGRAVAVRIAELLFPKA